jgi:hypothetical protein
MGSTSTNICTYTRVWISLALFGLILVLCHRPLIHAFRIRQGLKRALLSRHNSVDVVIAHYLEDVHALKTDIEKLLQVLFLSTRRTRIYIYTKGGNANVVEKIQGNFSNVRGVSVHISQLVNKGREGHVRACLLHQCLPYPYLHPPTD